MIVKTGTRVTARAQFADAQEVPDDPSTVTAKVRGPDGTVTTRVYGVDAAVVRDGVGAYHLDVDADAEGRWWVRLAGSGSGPVVAQEESFDVRSMF